MQERTKPRPRTPPDGKVIRRSKPSTDVVVKELDLATGDLETSKRSFQNRDYKWAIIQAYDSMLHASRALLNRMGYREQSHRGIIEALYQLYESEIIDEMLEDFSDAMNLTEQVYKGRPGSQRSAKKILRDATEFLEQSARILAAPREWFEKHPRCGRRARKR